MGKIKARESVTFTLAEVFPEFINSCRVKNLAKQSITSYIDKYKKLISIIHESTLCSDITKERISDFILALQDQKLSDASINTFIRGTKDGLFATCEESKATDNTHR